MYEISALTYSTGLNSYKMPYIQLHSYSLYCSLALVITPADVNYRTMSSKCSVTLIHLEYNRSSRSNAHIAVCKHSHK